MSADHTAVTTLAPELLRQLPIGVAVFDASRHAVVVNPAYCESFGLQPDAFPPGTSLEEIIRVGAHRGLYGPGDPEEQVREQLRADFSRPSWLLRRSFAGRTYDVHSNPLPDGGHVVCTVEVTALLEARTDAEAMTTRLSGAISTMRVGIAVFGPDGRLRLFNMRYSDLLGLPHDRLSRGMTMAEIQDLARRLDEYASADGQVFLAQRRDIDRRVATTVRRVRPNGQVIELSTDPLADGGWTVSVTDVSALTRAEDESRRRAGMLQGLLEAIPHGICVYGPDRRVTMFNPAYKEVMSGAPLAVGDKLEEVIRRRAEAGEYGTDDAARHFHTEMSHDISRPQVRRRVRPNGMAIDVRTAPLPDGGHVSVVTDVSPLAAAERALALRVGEMEAMLANIQHGIILWSAERRLIALNRVAEELLGLRPEPGEYYDDFIRRQHAHGVFGAGAAADALAVELISHNRHTPLRTSRPMGADGMIEIRSEPTQDGGFVTTLTDMSETRRTEAVLRQAKEAAESATASKARFLTTMSHELRTPLNAVIGFSDTLLRDRGSTDPAVVREYAEEINNSGKRLLLLVNTILDISRIEAGRYDLATDRVDFSRLVPTVLRQSRSAAMAGEITLLNDVPTDTPLVRGDERRMQQVLGHLVSNAVKFTDPGGTARVTTLVDENGDLLVQVSDTGIGIDEMDLDRVFEPFTQLDAGLERRYEGTGLSLYTSRAVVEAHGGTLLLRSRRSEGTTAEIRLPAQRVIGGEAERLASD